jgi:hypothetical protein
VEQIHSTNREKHFAVFDGMDTLLLGYCFILSAGDTLDLGILKVKFALDV